MPETANQPPVQILQLRSRSRIFGIHQEVELHCAGYRLEWEHDDVAGRLPDRWLVFMDNDWTETQDVPAAVRLAVETKLAQVLPLFKEIRGDGAIEEPEEDAVVSTAKCSTIRSSAPEVHVHNAGVVRLEADVKQMIRLGCGNYTVTWCRLVSLLDDDASSEPTIKWGVFDERGQYCPLADDASIPIWASTQLALVLDRLLEKSLDAFDELSMNWKWGLQRLAG